MNTLLEEPQISLPLEFPESKMAGLPEKVLVKYAQEGNGEAIEILYAKYKPLIEGHGPFLKKTLNYDTRGHTQEFAEDTSSILKLIFMESIQSYKDDRAAFSTYFVNRIKWKFRDKLFSERIIPVRNNKSIKEMKALLDATNCALVDVLSQQNIDRAVQPPQISFRAFKERFSMPIAAFIDGVFMEACENALSANEKRVYFFYLKAALQEIRGSISKVAKKFNMSPMNATKYINKCNEKVSRRLEIENVRFE